MAFFSNWFGRGRRGPEAGGPAAGTAAHGAEARGAATATETEARPSARRAEQAEKKRRMAEWEQQTREVEARNVLVREKRAKAKEAAGDGMRVIQEALRGNELSPSERSYYAWALDACKNAYNESLEQNQDEYDVKVKDGGGAVTSQRQEGMPVEDLLAIVKKAQEKIENKRSAKEQADLAHARYRVGVPEGQDQSKTEDERKLSWNEAYENVVPADHILRKAAEKLAREWEQEDARLGKPAYSAEERKKQLGEALKKVLIENGFIEEQNGKVTQKTVPDADPAFVARLDKIVQDLSEDTASGVVKKYFDVHSTREREQHPYTEREADFIAKDPRYKQALVGKYKESNELPRNFEQMDATGQDYALAMLAVRDRKLLVLPKEEPLPPKPEGVERKTIFRVNVSEIAQRMAKTLADARLEQYYEKSNWFYRKARALTENWNRLKFYDEALKEIMADQNLLKAMEARSLDDQTLAGQQADKRGVVKRALDIRTKKDRAHTDAAKTGHAYTPTQEEYFELMDSVMEEYDKDVIASREKGETLQASDALNAEVAKLLVEHQKGTFPDRATFEAYVKQHLEPLVAAETAGKQFSTDADKQKKAGELLFGMNFYQLAESYKDKITEMTAEYTAQCQAEGREVNQESLLAHIRGSLAFDLQLGLKDRDMANNKPEAFMAEYEKYKSGAGIFKFFNKGGKSRILFNPFTYGLVAGGSGGVISRAVSNGLSRKGLLVAGGVIGYGAVASFAAPILVGAGMGAYWAYKRRARQAEDDVRNAQRYEALGGNLSHVLDKKKTGLFRGENELRYSGTLQIQADAAITELNRLMTLTTLSDADKKSLANICARLDLKRDGIADLFKTGNETGKKFSSAQKVDSELKILRADLVDKFNLTDAAWQTMVGDIRKLLVEETNAAEKNITNFKKYEARKAGCIGFVAGAAGALVGQKIAYGGMEWLSKRMGFSKIANYFAHRGTTFDRAQAYFRGDRSKNLALFPFETAPGGGSRGVPLIDQMRNTGTNYDNHIMLSNDMHLHEISSGGGVKHLEVLDGSGRSLGKFDFNEATGKMAAVGTLDPSISFRENVVGGGGTRNAHQWLDSLRGRIPNGEVGEVHTRDWYDNQFGTGGEVAGGPHEHNLNELRFFVNRDTSGDLHFKVPVKPGDSWLINGRSVDFADINKAFTEDRMKIIFVPDGASPHEGITLEVNKVTKEVILPKGSDLQKLWDPVTNKFKGSGYFGLAEKVYESKVDGSILHGVPAAGTEGDYKVSNMWINSMRGDGSDIGFGEVDFTKITDEISHNIAEEGYGYDIAPTPGTWRRKKFNKKAKEQAAQTEEHGGQAGHGHGQEQHGAARTPEQTPQRRPELPAAEALEAEGGVEPEQPEVDDGDDEQPAAPQTAARTRATTGTTPRPAGTPDNGPTPAGGSTAPERRPAAGAAAARETDSDRFGREFEILKALYPEKLHMTNPDSREMPDAEKLAALKVFARALEQLPEDVRTRVLNRTNNTRSAPLNRGIILTFPGGASRLQFDSQDRLIIPRSATADQIKTFLEREFAAPGNGAGPGPRPAAGAARARAVRPRPARAGARH